MSASPKTLLSLLGDRLVYTADFGKKQFDLTSLSKTDQRQVLAGIEQAVSHIEKRNSYGYDWGIDKLFTIAFSGANISVENLCRMINARPFLQRPEMDQGRINEYFGFGKKSALQEQFETPRYFPVLITSYSLEGARLVGDTLDFFLRQELTAASTMLNGISRADLFDRKNYSALEAARDSLNRAKLVYGHANGLHSPVEVVRMFEEFPEMASLRNIYIAISLGSDSIRNQGYLSNLSGASADDYEMIVKRLLDRGDSANAHQMLTELASIPQIGREAALRLASRFKNMDVAGQIGLTIGEHSGPTYLKIAQEAIDSQVCNVDSFNQYRNMSLLAFQNPSQIPRESIDAAYKLFSPMLWSADIMGFFKEAFGESIPDSMREFEITSWLRHEKDISSPKSVFGRDISPKEYFDAAVSGLDFSSERERTSELLNRARNYRTLSIREYLAIRSSDGLLSGDSSIAAHMLDASQLLDVITGEYDKQDTTLNTDYQVTTFHDLMVYLFLDYQPRADDSHWHPGTRRFMEFCESREYAPETVVSFVKDTIDKRIISGTHYEHVWKILSDTVKEGSIDMQKDILKLYDFAMEKIADSSDPLAWDHLYILMRDKGERIGKSYTPGQDMLKLGSKMASHIIQENNSETRSEEKLRSMISELNKLLTSFKSPLPEPLPEAFAMLKDDRDALMTPITGSVRLALEMGLGYFELAEKAYARARSPEYAKALLESSLKQSYSPKDLIPRLARLEGASDEALSIILINCLTHTDIAAARKISYLIDHKSEFDLQKLASTWDMVPNGELKSENVHAAYMLNAKHGSLSGILTLGLRLLRQGEVVILREEESITGVDAAIASGNWSGLNEYFDGCSAADVTAGLHRRFSNGIPYAELGKQALALLKKAKLITPEEMPQIKTALEEPGEYKIDLARFYGFENLTALELCKHVLIPYFDNIAQPYQKPVADERQKLTERVLGDKEFVTTAPEDCKELIALASMAYNIDLKTRPDLRHIVEEKRDYVESRILDSFRDRDGNYRNLTRDELAQVSSWADYIGISAVSEMIKICFTAPSSASDFLPVYKE